MSTNGAPAEPTRPGSLLYVGCGHEPLPEWLQELGLSEVRLDIDERCKPDIIASMDDLGQIGPFDLIFSAHSLEHLPPHRVDVALAEFHRVLADRGSVIVLVPDLEDVRPTEDVVYVSDAGPVTGLDMFYGLRSCLAAQPHMAHQTGFVRETLQGALERAGFSNAKTERLSGFNLMGVGRK